MSSYEFWDELGKIFNAVVAYQEKNLEFNKRFISPWIRLGNIFEKQDRNKEAVNAYERAIEIDGANPQNWFELGNIHFKMENYPEAVSALNRAIALDPDFGLAYSNLGLTLATTGDTEQAIASYQQGIALLQDARDKAEAWNRLGNAYRKLNQYKQALDAFHKADELDRENAGFRDSLDEQISGPSLEQAGTDDAAESAGHQSVSPIKLIVAENRAAETEAQQAAEAEALEIAAPEAAAIEAGIVTPANAEMAPTGEAPTDESVPAIRAEPAAGSAQAEAAAAEQSVVAEQPESSAETVTVVLQDSTETFTETMAVASPATEATDAKLTAEVEATTADQEPALTTDLITAEDDVPTDRLHVQDMMLQDPQLAAAAALREALSESDEMPEAALDPAPNSLADQLLEAEPGVLEVPQHAAYEEYLKDTNEPIDSFGMEEREAVELPGSPEPAAKIDASGDLQIEMDTKNAHVWNELGNVYYNSSAFDDAIVAYSKAIELDRWFAWPYSNLALAYVQKRRFVEAILLYQRSIELFSSDKDKAISWNRLGNVYRRLNDYENAIAAYQRADALDPDNSTLSLQSRFSLLGNYATEQKPSYVS